MSNLVFNGPAEFEMKVFVVNDETGMSGRATIGLGCFKYPSKEEIKERINKFQREEMVEALEGFRLMTKEEAFEMVTYERTGERFAMVGKKEWDDI